MKTGMLAMAVLLCGLCPACAQLGKVTVKVTGVDGVPIPGANVSAGFSTQKKPGWGWGAGPDRVYTGMTDTNGICVLSGHGDGGSVWVKAGKDGFYRSKGYEIIFTNVTWGLGRRWQPWNPTFDVVLKKVGNPIPMYARHLIYMRLPAMGEDIGYDLTAGDWTPPHGKGETADMVFKMTGEEFAFETYDGEHYTRNKEILTVSFPNPGDGLILVPVPKHGSSVLRLEGPAPETGYIPTLVKDNRFATQQINNFDDDANYYIRVRTRLDEKGNVVSALYGKIYGDIMFANGKDLTFTYFLNPTPNDRNVEFDPDRNLFGPPFSWETWREGGVFVP